MSLVAPKQRICIVLLAGLVLAASAVPADLALETVSGPLDNSVSVQVRVLDRSGPSSAIQFDLEHPASLSFAGSPGPIVSGSGKTLYSGTLAAGGTRFLVVGLNSTPIPEGVLISLAATVGADTQPGNYSLAIRNALASDPGGDESPVSGAETNFTLGGSVPEMPSGLIPHLSMGNGWSTTVSVYNPSPAASPVRIASWNSGGGPLVVPWAVPVGGPVGGTGNSTELTIQPNGTLDLVAGDPAIPEATLGWAQLFAPAGVSGWVTYALKLPSGQLFETVVPVERRTPVSSVIPFDDSSGYSTSVAVANSSGSGGAVVLVVARDAEGRHLFSDLLQLPVLGHTFFQVAQRYSALAGLRGTLEFQNTRDGAIGVIGLRTHSSGTLAAVSPAAKD